MCRTDWWCKRKCEHRQARTEKRNVKNKLTTTQEFNLGISSLQVKFLIEADGLRVEKSTTGEV
jgi:hypothetical protein